MAIWTVMIALSIAAVYLVSQAPFVPENAHLPRPQKGLQKVTSEELLKTIKNSKAPALLLNLWATWCDPCKEEMPDILRLHKELASQGLELLLVSVDNLSQLKEAEAFLKEQGVQFPTYIKYENDEKFITTLLKDWSGTLPTSVIFTPGGKVAWFHPAQANYEQFRRQVENVLGISATESPSSGGTL